jgi:2-oxo-3-(phosphooxy)propyl 3-oxoalkanoate synthase
VSSFPLHLAKSFVKTAGAPRFEATIPREFAHKRAVEEVFLTDIIVDQDNERVLACAQLPRGHALYNEVENGVHDLLLILETGRQGMTIYGHVRLDVAEGTAFVMSGLRVEVIDLDALRQGDAPGELVIDVPYGEERRDGRGRVRGYTLKGAGEIDGRPAIEITGEALLIPEALYERVRAVRVEEGVEIPPAPEPVEPVRVGRRLARNVVVGDAVHSGGELRCSLIADTTHPSFFDHPLDHVPGMLMLETARQAALLYVDGLGWSPTETVLDACEAHFTQYAALSPPATCCVRASERPPGGEPSPGGSAAPVEYLRASFAQAGLDIGYVDLRLRLTGA